MKYFVYGEDSALKDRTESIHADLLSDLANTCVKNYGIVKVFLVLTESEAKIARKRAKSLNKML